MPDRSSRVWCFTPNPVVETKFVHGRRAIAAGGKGHNVAQQLRAWRVPAFSVVAKAGTKWIQAAKKDGSPIREIPIHSAARTGWAFLEQAGKRLDFFTEDPQWKTADWNQCGKFLLRVVRSGDWLVVAGSTPKGARPGWWKSLFLGLKKRGGRILVDGKGQLLREGLQAGVDWAKANLAEVEETMNRRGMGRCLAGMRTLSRGRSCLVVTLGPRGLMMEVGRTKMAVPAPKVRLWDATGSGDVVTAALIYGIHHGWEIEKLAGFAAWAGSENAARRHGVVKRLKG